MYEKFKKASFAGKKSKKSDCEFFCEFTVKSCNISKIHGKKLKFHHKLVKDCIFPQWLDLWFIIKCQIYLNFIPLGTWKNVASRLNFYQWGKYRYNKIITTCVHQLIGCKWRKQSIIRHLQPTSCWFRDVLLQSVT